VLQPLMFTLGFFITTVQIQKIVFQFVLALVDVSMDIVVDISKNVIAIGIGGRGDKR